ncbi:MAG TPA: CHASE3 domain-containing protein, partial [Thermomicrobiales bacterium]
MNLRTQIIRGQAASWFLVLLVSVVVVFSIQRNLTSAEERRQALAQLTQIGVVKTDVLDLETGLRGYLLTADTQFLQPFDRARASISEDIDTE